MAGRIKGRRYFGNRFSNVTFFGSMFATWDVAWEFLANFEAVLITEGYHVLFILNIPIFYKNDFSLVLAISQSLFIQKNFLHFV